VKLAYVISWGDGGTSGVFHKVHDQVSAWREYGHDARIFVATTRESAADWRDRDSSVHVTEYSGSTRSVVAQRRIVAAVDRFAPDLVYVRPSLRNAWVTRQLSAAPVVAEIQTRAKSEAATQSSVRLAATHLARRALRVARGAVFVTAELAGQEEYAHLTPVRAVIGNGIDLSRHCVVPPPDATLPPALLFVGSSDLPWHGIDQILDFAATKPDWRFHLVGVRGPSTTGLLNVETHGPLTPGAIAGVAARCDIGIGTLALYRKGMQEATPLKVREYLALGLPVVGAYLDTDIPTDAPYFLRLPNEPGALVSHQSQVEDFVHAWKGRRVARTAVLQIDSRVKEAERLSFFSEVAQAARQGLVSRVR
jgi:glycosyltransferase involved in cell wall biosynthesis